MIKIKSPRFLIYINDMIRTINKPTRVTKKTATAIDHFITNGFPENTLKTAIIKSDVSDHFRICIFIPSTNLFAKMMLSINIKANMKQFKLFFKISISVTEISLKPIRMQMKLTIIPYKHFVHFNFFPVNKMKIKTKDLEILE